MKTFPVLLPVNGEQRLARHRQSVKEVSNGKFYDVSQAQWYLRHKVYGDQGYLRLSAALSKENVKRSELDGQTYIKIAEAHSQLVALLESITLGNENTSELSRGVINKVIRQLTPQREASHHFIDLIDEVERYGQLTESDLLSTARSTSPKTNLQQFIDEAIIQVISA